MARMVFRALLPDLQESPPFLDLQGIRLAIFTLFGLELPLQELREAVTHFRSSQKQEPETESSEEGGHSMYEVEYLQFVTQQAACYQLGLNEAWALWDALDPCNRGYITAGSVSRVASNVLSELTTIMGQEGESLLTPDVIDGATACIGDVDDDGDGRVIGADLRRALDRR